MEEERKNSIYKYIITVVLTFLITFIVTAVGVYKYAIGTTNYYIKSSKSSEASLDQTLGNFKKILEEKYVGEIDEEKLKEGAIKGYIEGLGDPYTEYYTKEEMKSLTEDLEGEYVGIGIYTTYDTERNVILVLSTIDGSPAKESGLNSGDIITKIDDVEYKGENLEEAVKKMKGEEGTKVKITILRNNEEKEFEIIRKSIKISHVSSKIMEDDIGYINISSFEGGCYEEFYNNYKELKAKNAKSLIIDLRFNGGGLVNEALNIAELMVPKGKTLLITKDNKNTEKITESKTDKIIDMQVVVLVNNYSASASEILTGILKENVNAKIIGTKTYGKGVMQTVYPLTDGSGLKITTDEYYTPNHNKINKIGIEPTIEVKLPEELKTVTNLKFEEDLQLQKAIEELKK